MDCNGNYKVPNRGVEGVSQAGHREVPDKRFSRGGPALRRLHRGVDIPSAQWRFSISIH